MGWRRLAFNSFKLFLYQFVSLCLFDGLRFWPIKNFVVLDAFVQQNLEQFYLQAVILRLLIEFDGEDSPSESDELKATFGAEGLRGRNELLMGYLYPGRGVLHVKEAHRSTVEEEYYIQQWDQVISETWSPAIHGVFAAKTKYAKVRPPTFLDVVPVFVIYTGRIAEVSDL